VIVVTGGSGQLGTAFHRLLGDDAIVPSRTEVDLTDPEGAAAAVARLRPTLVINCAAYTAVDAAEEDRDTARLVNAVAVGELAAACARVGAGFVTFSTDYVFDGESERPYVESDPTGPGSVYGATKQEGETLALAAHPGALVIRTSWLLSGTHPNFAATMLRLGASRELRVVDDQRGHPTLVSDLAPATLAAIDAGATGLLHLTNAGVVSWFELAREVLTIAGMDPSVISPCSTADYPLPARRPTNSVLASERIGELGLAPLPHYRPALEAAVARLTRPGPAEG
jgi:dTDP-4-dehydrorhamnose reductase